MTRPMRLHVRSSAWWHYIVRVAVVLGLSYPAWLISHLATHSLVIGWIILVLLWGLVFEVDASLAKWLNRRH